VPYPRLACLYPSFLLHPCFSFSPFSFPPLISTIPTNHPYSSSLSPIWLQPSCGWTALVRLTDRHRCFLFLLYLFMNSRAAIFFGASKRILHWLFSFQTFVSIRFTCHVLVFFFHVLRLCLTVMFLALPKYPVSTPPNTPRLQQFIVVLVFYVYFLVCCVRCVFWICGVNLAECPVNQVPRSLAFELGSVKNRF